MLDLVSVPMQQQLLWLFGARGVAARRLLHLMITTTATATATATATVSVSATVTIATGITASNTADAFTATARPMTAVVGICIDGHHISTGILVRTAVTGGGDFRSGRIVHIVLPWC